MRSTTWLAFAFAFVLGGCSGASSMSAPDLAGSPSDLSSASDLRSSPDSSGAPDLATADLSTPDLAMPDLATPDLATPDLAMPDLVTPDLVTPPDLATPDLSVRVDFSTPPDFVAPRDLATATDMVPDPPSQSKSSLTAHPTSAPADGVSVVTLTVIVKDAGGVALAGQSVGVSSSGTNNTIAPASGTTNASGVFSATFSSTTAEQKTVTAIIGGFQLQTTVTFTSGGACAGTPLLPGLPHVTAPSPAGLVLGDWNGDGTLDLATTNDKNPGSVNVSLGNGDGTFQAAVPYATDLFPVRVAAADLNGDRKLDLVVACNGSSFSGNEVDVLLGNGDGTFQPSVKTDLPQGPNGLTIGDFNADGKLDVATVNTRSGGNNVAVLLGNGDGTLQPYLGTTVNGSMDAIASGDLDKDGKLDVVLANGTVGSSTATVLLGKGDGTFKPQVDYALNTPALAITVGDFNKDGKLDVATDDQSNFVGKVSVLLGNGDGTLGPAADFTGGGGRSIRAFDFNNDGKLDLAAIDGNNDVEVLQGNGDGTFKPGVAYLAAGAGIALDNDVAAGDVDGDGVIDLLATRSTDNGVAILAGKGDGTFKTVPNYAMSGPARGVVAGDFNGDGKLDLVASNYSLGAVSAMVGNGDGTFKGAVDATGGAVPFGIVSGDFNKDGKLDVATANSATANVSFYAGNGDGTFKSGTSSTVAQAATSLAVADFNKDGSLDLVTPNQSSGNVSLLLGNGDGTFQPHVEVTTSVLPVRVLAGDFNKDGNPDVIAATGQLKISVLLGNGNGTFQTHVEYTAGTSQPQALASGDFNGDTKLDVAVANINGKVGVLLGNGDGTFQPMIEYDTGGMNTIAVASGDYTGDGKIDLAVANYGFNTAVGGNDLALLVGNGDGTFRAAITYPANASPASLASGDFNGDGKLDVAVGDAVTLGVSVLLYRGCR